MSSLVPLDAEQGKEGRSTDPARLRHPSSLEKGESSQLTADGEVLPTLWVNVVEGVGFPINLGAIYVSVTYNTHKVESKSITHDTDNPHWGEVFVFDYSEIDEGVVLNVQVKARKDIHSINLLDIDIPLGDVSRGYQIFQWVRGSSHHESCAHSSVLVQIRQSSLPPMSSRLNLYKSGHHLHMRLSSLRFELMSLSVRPNSRLTGCLVFSPSRERHAEILTLEVHHYSTTVYENSLSTFEFFRAAAEIPHEFQVQEHGKFVISPETYLWPFQITLPPHLYSTGRFKGKDEEYVISLDLLVNIGHSKSTRLKLEVPADVSPPQNASSIPGATIHFMTGSPFMIDDFEPHQMLNRPVISDCLNTLPASGYCTKLYDLLYK